MKINIPDKISTWYFVVLSVVFLFFIMLLIAGLAHKEPVNTTQTVWEHTDFLFPNLVWLVAAFGIILHGFKLVSITNVYDEDDY